MKSSITLQSPSVLFLAGENLSRRSGGTVATVAVSNALSQCVEDFRRIAFSEDGTGEVPHRVIGKTNWLPASSVPLIQLAINSRRLLRATEAAVADRVPDVAIVRIGPQTLPAQRWLRRRGIPIVALARGTIRPEQASGAVRRLLRKLERARFCQGMKICDRLYCAYDEIADGACRLRGTQSGVYVLSNAVEPSEFPLLDRDATGRARERYAIPKDAFVVGFVGSLQERHCLEVLLQAAAWALRTIPELRIVLVGDGPLREALRVQAESLKILEIVHFTGFVNRDEVGEVTGMCDVLFGVVHPLYKSNPIKCYEYLAAGRFIITSQVEELKFVKELQCGIQVDEVSVSAVSSAILDTYKMGHVERNRRADKGREYVLRQHTWQRFANTLLTFPNPLGVTTPEKLAGKI